MANTFFKVAPGNLKRKARLVVLMWVRDGVGPSAAGENEVRVPVFSAMSHRHGKMHAAKSPTKSSPDATANYATAHWLNSNLSWSLEPRSESPAESRDFESP